MTGMLKKVHIWEVQCRNCGTHFEHVFVASDILKPHILNLLEMKCPKCGDVKFDPVKSLEKLSLEEWKLKYPEIDISTLPDHSYIE